MFRQLLLSIDLFHAVSTALTIVISAFFLDPHVDGRSHSAQKVELQIISLSRESVEHLL